MHSVLNYLGPRALGINDFTDIFMGTVLEHLKDNSNMISPTNAKAVPSAVRYFRDNVVGSENPISVLERSFDTQSPFLPGTSLISIPVVERPQYARNYHKDSEWDRAADTNLFLRIGEVEACIDRNDWARIFGQIPSAALTVADERGFDPVIKIPSFNNRFPNYFEGLAPNYMPEGLEVGTIIIDGSVGEYCGKHSNGGRVVVNGSTGQFLADCSRNVEYIVKDFSGKPTQATNCAFYSGLSFRAEQFGNDVSKFELNEIRENGCSVYEFVNFKKGVFERDGSRSLDGILTVKETQSLRA